MRSIISATLIVTGMALAGPATAAPMFSFNVEQIARRVASTKLTAWQSGMKDFATEDFEGFDSYPDDTSPQYNPVSSLVGSFSAGGDGGKGSACVPESGSKPCKKTIVKDDSASNDAGRNTTVGGNNWLDSNDVQETIWNISADGLRGDDFNRLAFFLIDAADVGATVNVTLANGGSGSFELSDKLSDLVDGNVQFITGSFAKKVTAATLTVKNLDGTNTTRDGWGIDGASVAVPTPGTLALFGLGLLGLGAAARRCRS